jgi:tRNA pseudouridine65 synthase
VNVLYRDEHILAVDKPAGMIVHRGWADDEDTAVDRARAIAGDVYPMHRLDRGTSGVLLFALAPELVAQIEWIEKIYICAVRGRPPPEGVIDSPVRKGEEPEPRVPALTRFTTLSTSPIARYSLVEARPETGRLHQIRRHMKHATHPILGDVRYGKREHNHYCRDHFGLRRMALHARSLTLKINGASITIEAPLPEDLIAPLRAMQLLPSPG